MKNKARILSLYTGILLIGISCAVSCTQQAGSREDVHSAVRQDVKPYRFDFVAWEVQTLFGLTGGEVTKQENASDEAILKDQIEEVLHENSITVFPPLRFSLEEPPHLLVISPRDRIAYYDRVLLSQHLSMNDMEHIEAQVDELGVSSLVTDLGGFGATYPTIVTDDASITFTIDAVVEEWLHQYLARKPLGFRYLLDSMGIRQDPDVIVLNETLASMVSEEIGAEVYARYYKSGERIETENKQQNFDFDTEMRKTRKVVDQYLDAGDIKGAEQYMEVRRKVFVAKGYNIRKLNQAYFAFHGIYGDDPASVSPIYAEMEQLRGKSTTLKDFLDRTSAMTGYSDLKDALAE
jgi:hypothetical protein